MECRRATKEDLSGIIEVWKESQEYHYNLDHRLHLNPDASEHVKKYYDGQFFNEDAVMFIAEVEDKIVGYASAILRKQPPIRPEEFHGFIDSVVVSAEYRGRGIGTKLFEQVMEWLKQKEIVTVRLSVAAKNPVGIAFWQKMGFSELMLTLDYKINS